MAPAKASKLRDTELMAEEREDLVLGIEGSNCSDVAHSLPCNHACLCMSLGSVSSKPFQRKLLGNAQKYQIQQLVDYIIQMDY